jgi:hypothetical protein
LTLFNRQPAATHTKEIVYRDRPNDTDHEPQLNQPEQSWWGEWSVLDTDTSETNTMQEKPNISWNATNLGCDGEDGIINRYLDTLHKYPTKDPHPYSWIKDQYDVCIENGYKPKESHLA